MRIYIPSAGRSGQVAVGPVADFSPRIRRRTVFVVPESEMQDYARELQHFNVGLISCPERGIARTRHFIGQFASRRGEESFAMCDDDVRFVRRESSERTNLIPCDVKDVEDMWDCVETFLRSGYGHVGVSARQGNNRLPTGGYDAHAQNTRTLRVLCYRTQDFLSVEHGRVDVMEDFDVNLQLLRAGIPNANLAHWSQDQKMTNAPGGCSTYRDHEVHEKSARRLAELHPGFVALRQKQNKTGGSFGTRTEVTIYWKKAYESSGR